MVEEPSMQDIGQFQTISNRMEEEQKYETQAAHPV